MDEQPDLIVWQTMFASRSEKCALVCSMYSRERRQVCRDEPCGAAGEDDRLEGVLATSPRF